MHIPFGHLFSAGSKVMEEIHGESLIWDINSLSKDD